MPLKIKKTEKKKAKTGRLETALQRYVIFRLGETFDLPSSDVDSRNLGQIQNAPNKKDPGPSDYLFGR